MSDHLDYLKNSRREYFIDVLEESKLIKDPFQLFDYWFNEAVDKHILDANAVNIATVDTTGNPHMRVVLLRSYDTNGFVFFTNYKSAKGQQIEHNPNVCLHFFWKELVRQVQIQGTIEKVDPKISDDYFQSRPTENQLSALVSPQSECIENRKFLEDRYTLLSKEYKNKKINRPAHWGGYRVKPVSFEFWQGRPSRLHDRFLYTHQTENTWTINRLAP